MDFTSVILLCAAGLSLTSATCWNNSARLHIEQLNPSIPIRNGDFDAQKVVTGPLYQLGDYNQCLYKLEAQYCLTEIQLTPADNLSQQWQKIQESNSIPTNVRRDKLFVGICEPKQCSNLEIKNDFEESLSATAQNLGIKATISVNEHDCQTKDGRPLTTTDVIVGFVLGSIILLVLCGSIYDGIRRLQKCENQIQTIGGRLLVCFSLLTNFQKLGVRSNTNNSERFQFIEVLRYLGTYLVICTHTILWAMCRPIQNPEWLEETYTSTSWNTIRLITAWLGMFLGLSGFLSSYFIIHFMHGRGSISMADILKAILHRYLRLTPAYAVMVALEASWFSHLGNGPMWNRLVGIEAENCRQNWWINLLYLNNYINVSKMCLPHTWYIAADFQCFLTSMLILVLVWKYPRFDKMILSAVMLLWILVPFLQTYFERLDPTVLWYPDTFLHFRENRTFQRMYVSLQGNAGAYFAGVIFGYVYYHIRHTHTKRTRLAYLVFWSISLTLHWIVPIIGSTFYQPSYTYNVLTASFYSCAFRTVTGIGTAVSITGIALGYGGIFNNIASWRPFQALGQLTYTIYLIHFCLQNLEAGATNKPIYLDTYSLFRSSLSDMIIATGLALLLYLFVEMPFASIMKEFIPSGKNVNNNGVHPQTAAVEKDGTNINILDDNSTKQIASSHLKYL